MKLIGRDFTNDLTVFMQRGELYLFVLIKEGVICNREINYFYFILRMTGSGGIIA